MGWTKVCETAQSGIWVPKGIPRTHMFPANLPRGVVPVGLGDGVGDCHDAADLQRDFLFISPLNFSGGENYAPFKGMLGYP